VFTDKQLGWGAFALAVLTVGVISISAPAYPEQRITVLPVKPYNPSSPSIGHVMPAPPAPQTRHPILPPVEYDKPYDGDLTIKMVPTFEALRIACNVYNPAMLACAIHNAKSCVIYLVEDEVMRQRGWNTGLLLRHEIGHCNGWPGDHPGQRAVPSPLTHWVPVSERINR
jgi:hypothetical protein